jgi:hypothetical protein
MVLKSTQDEGRRSSHDILIFHFGKFFLIPLDGFYDAPYCRAITPGAKIGNSRG